MKFTDSLKNNYEFRRLYARGKSAATPLVVLYCRKNGQKCSRLGITVGGKIGKAVRRNIIRRRLKEIYRIHEGEFLPGWDIVAVARFRSTAASFTDLERDFLLLSGRLGLLVNRERRES